jgi:hypothetical protein
MVVVQQGGVTQLCVMLYEGAIACLVMLFVVRACEP